MLQKADRSVRPIEKKRSALVITCGTVLEKRGRGSERNAGRGLGYFEHLTGENQMFPEI
jgi:hypothetical protein